MIEINVCPSTLKAGYNTYSPAAVKEVFSGNRTSPYIDIDFENEAFQSRARENMSNHQYIHSS